MIDVWEYGYCFGPQEKPKGCVQFGPTGSRAAAAPADREEPVSDRVFAPPVLTTAPGPAERDTGCRADKLVVDADIDPSWLIGDFFEVASDPGAVDGTEADLPDTVPVPECAVPIDGVEFVVVDAESDDDSEVDGRAEATQGVAANAVPMPSATANAPTRPICFA